MECEGMGVLCPSISPCHEDDCTRVPRVVVVNHLLISGQHWLNMKKAEGQTISVEVHDDNTDAETFASDETYAQGLLTEMTVTGASTGDRLYRLLGHRRGGGDCYVLVQVQNSPAHRMVAMLALVLAWEQAAGDQDLICERTNRPSRRPEGDFLQMSFRAETCEHTIKLRIDDLTGWAHVPKMLHGDIRRMQTNAPPEPTASYKYPSAPLWDAPLQGLVVRWGSEEDSRLGGVLLVTYNREPLR